MPVFSTELTIPVRIDHSADELRSHAGMFKTPRANWLLLLLFMLHGAWAAVSIGVGNDLLFAPRARALFLSYRPPTQHWVYFAGGWRGENDDEVYGAGYRCGFGRLSLMLGASYLTSVNDINGTRWNFAIQAAYQLGQHWALTYRHFSNADFIFHWSTGPNRGWNFLSIDYLFNARNDIAPKTCIP